MCRKSFIPAFAGPLTEDGGGGEVAEDEEIWHEILPRLARDGTDTAEKPECRERGLVNKAEDEEERETFFDGTAQ